MDGMSYPKNLNIIKKSHNTYMVYILSLLVCLFLILHVFPVKIKAAEQKRVYETLIEPTFREYPGAMQGFDDTHPIWVPDGKTLAFTRVYKDEKNRDKNGIYMFQPGSGGRYITPIITGQRKYHFLAESGNSEQFFHPGYFSWLQLQAVPDEVEPRRNKDNISQYYFIYEKSSNLYIGRVRDNRFTTALFVEGLYNDGNQPIAGNYYVDYSDGNRHIAFVSRMAGSEGIYAKQYDDAYLSKKAGVDVKLSTAKLLAKKPTLAFNPRWSPDGKHLTFNAPKTESIENSDIFVIYDVLSDNPGDPIRLTKSEANETHPTWSPDGKLIAYYSSNPETSGWGNSSRPRLRRDKLHHPEHRGRESEIDLYVINLAGNTSSPFERANNTSSPFEKGGRGDYSKIAENVHKQWRGPVWLSNLLNTSHRFIIYISGNKDKINIVDMDETPAKPIAIEQLSGYKYGNISELSCVSDNRATDSTQGDVWLAYSAKNNIDEQRIYWGILDPKSWEVQEVPEILRVADVSIKTDEQKVALTVKNSGAIALKDVTSNLTASGEVNVADGPNPPSADIKAGTSPTFTWTYTIISEPTENIRFTASASGIDSYSGKSVSTRLFTKAYPGTERQSVTILSGHTDTVTSVTFNSDGTLLASGSLDGTIKLWNPTTGEQIRKIEAHADILSIAFSPNGKTLASGASDGTVKLWNPATGEEVRSLKGLPSSEAKGHKGQVFSVAFSPKVNGRPTSVGKISPLKRDIQDFPDRYLASSSWNGIIKIWDYQTGEELHTLKEGNGDVLSISFSPNGQWFAAGSADNKIYLWNPKTWEVIPNTFSEHTGQVLSVAFGLDSKQLASGSADGTIKLWDVQTKKFTRTIRGDEGNVHAVAFSTDRKLLASGTADGIIKLWNLKTGEAMYTFKEHAGGVFSVAFHPDGQLLASSSQDKTLKLWRNIGFLSVYIVDKDSFSKPITTRRTHIKFAVEHLSLSASKDILYSWQFNNEDWTDSKINSVPLDRADGEYTFRVKATSTKWKIDPTLVEVNFTIAASPETIIEEKKPLFITTRNATIHFSGKDARDATSNLLYSWRFDNNERWSEFSLEKKVPPKNMKNLSGGKHLFRVRAKDTEGNIDPTPAEIVFEVASQFPNTQIVNPPTKTIRTTDITLQFTGSDRQTPTEKLKYSWRVDGGEWSESPNETTEANFETSEGWHLFEVKAIDENENEDPTPEQVSFQVVLGILLPETQITNAPKETVKKADYTFNLKGSDIPRYKWRLDGEKKWHETKGTSVTVPKLSDGRHLFEAKAINQNGSEDPTPARVSFEVTVEKPDTKIINAPKETVKTEDYTFELRGSDVHKYRWRYDGEEWQETTKTSVTLKNLFDSTHVFEAIAINQNGSEDPEPARVLFQVAIEKPETQITKAPKDIVKTEDYTFEFNGSDIHKYKWRLDGENWKEITGKTFVAVSNLSDGWHIFEAQAINKDGSMDPEPDKVSFQVAIDRGLPNTVVEELVTTTHHNFKLRGSDINKYAYILDKEDTEENWKNPKVSEGEETLTIKGLSDGYHLLRIKAINRDGSEDPTPRWIFFRVAIEKSLPDTEIINPPENPILATSYTFKLNGSDNQHYKWRLASQEEDWHEVVGSSSVTVTDLSSGLFWDIFHVFEAVAINKDGGEDPEPARGQFKVASFYKRHTTLFIVILLVFVCISISLFVWYRFIRPWRKRRRKFNPYIVGDPVLNEKMFFGRDKLLEKVIDGLSGGSIAIYGDRRIGKTSILRQLEKKLVEKKLEKPYLPIYVDIEGKSEDEFFRHLMHAIVDGCDGYISDTSQLRIQQDNDRYSSSSFGSDLWKVIQQLKSTYAEDAILVLLLDEIDQTEEYDQSMHQVLRSFFMRHVGELKMIAAGVHITGKAWSKKTSPWYNFFSRLETPPFEEEDAMKLIEEPIKHIYGYSNEAVEDIVKYSDYQPYYIQIFCRYSVGKIIEEKRKKVTRADVEYVLTNVILKEHSSTFLEHWNTLSEGLQKEIRNALELEGTSGKIGDEVTRDVLEENNIMNPFKEWIRRNCL